MPPDRRTLTAALAGLLLAAVACGESSPATRGSESTIGGRVEPTRPAAKTTAATVQTVPSPTATTAPVARTPAAAPVQVSPAGIRSAPDSSPSVAPSAVPSPVEVPRQAAPSGPAPTPVGPAPAPTRAEGAAGPTPSPAGPLARSGEAPTAPTRFDPSRVHLGAEQRASGFVQPVLVTHAGDGSGRIFVLEKGGRIRLIDGSVFLDIRDRVIAPALFSYEREQGLLGLAFHPRFSENGYFYVHYNGLDGNHVISRFGLRPDGSGDPASETVLLRERQPETNFNGGMLAFGPDGYLYIGLGTGGASVPLQQNAQDLGSLLGKLLRIDVDGGQPYGIPRDNPFINTPGARPEVWAYGLRNPWRFSFDRATGDLYIGGPGEFQREWINFQPAGSRGGENYGWPILEGTTCWRTQTCDSSGLSLPIIEYPTYENGNCVVIGGYVYRGPSYPLLQGAYLYGDFCSGRIWTAARDHTGAWVSTEMLGLSTLISSFGEDEAGEVYVTDINRGIVFRLTATPR